jgi:hypothetical protein
MKTSDHDEIERLKSEGHTNHCACRIAWGDGMCECGQNGKGIPGSISKEITKPFESRHK